MSTRSEVLKLLSDGSFHSGTDMGRSLGISRAAVCKTIKVLARSGLLIHRVPGRGYRLDTPCSPLERTLITQYLRTVTDVHPYLHVLDKVDSTNEYLLQRSADLESGTVCVAETQSRGRGRRGRSWVTTAYANVMMSMAWRFPSGPGVVTGLSLAAGVALAHALKEFGITGIGLKWPNDIVWRDLKPGALAEESCNRKLAGILIDVQGEATGPCLVVLGLGVNVALSVQEAQEIDQPWTDLQRITGKSIDRNRLLALLIACLHRMFYTFEQTGLDSFRDEWERLHIYSGKPVQLHHSTGSQLGVVSGIDNLGALLVRDASGVVRAYHSGEISMRPVL